MREEPMQTTDSIHHSAILPAEYSLAELPEHRGNPLIEALPRSPTVENLMDTLGVYPDFHDTDRCLPASVRMQAIMRLNDYFEPLPRHIGLGLQLNVVLRSGYRHRNPVDKEFRKNMVRFYRESMEGNVVPIVPAKPSTAPSFALFGVSGIGKSTAIEQLLAFVPQAICHKDHGFIQLVWLKLDCPLDGSLKQFLISAIGKIDDILGTNYMESAASGKSIDRLVVDFAKIASSHYLGLLVLDETQNLLDASGVSQAKLLNFTVTLANETKIPVITIGTLRSLALLQGTFRSARRIGNFGTTLWTEMKNDEEWDFLVGGLWKYQWTEHFTRFTKGFSNQMHHLSAGVPALPVRLHQLTQLEAIRTGTEHITEELLSKVAEEHLQPLQPMLAALRAGDYAAADRYSDLFACWLPMTDLTIRDPNNSVQVQDLALAKKRRAADRMRAASIIIAAGASEEQAGHLLDHMVEARPDLDMSELARSLKVACAANAKGDRAALETTISDIIKAAESDGKSTIDALRAAGVVTSPRR
jgi:hypothetical protein